MISVAAGLSCWRTFDGKTPWQIARVKLVCAKVLDRAKPCCFHSNITKVAKPERGYADHRSRKL